MALKLYFCTDNSVALFQTLEDDWRLEKEIVNSIFFPLFLNCPAMETVFVLPNLNGGNILLYFGFRWISSIAIYFQWCIAKLLCWVQFVALRVLNVTYTCRNDWIRKREIPWKSLVWNMADAVVTVYSTCFYFPSP